ncbi:MAG: hypothetical protein PHW60_06275 [Kiritimatiellae bacterium]|nr:hypothetical protein [Kiritimatiellia bacterium]
MTGEYVDYGAPLPRTSWSYHRVDTQRGVMYAVSFRNEFLAWNINMQKAEWAGYLPQGMVWQNRALLVDSKSGRAYTSNGDPGDKLQRMIRYDYATKRFTLLDCHMPANPAPGSRLRGHTRERGPDGLFWCLTEAGELFTFNPDSEEISDKGLNWPGDGRFACSLERSPGGRYLYYSLRSEQSFSPVIQYDIKTGTKKVLAFLHPYYHEKYGYLPAGSYSLKLDDKGENIFMVWNGAFIETTEKLGVDFWGHCAVVLLRIPSAEREE